MFFNFIRPVLGPRGCCKFQVSCLNYAKNQFQESDCLRAILNIIKRLISCI